MLLAEFDNIMYRVWCYACDPKVKITKLAKAAGLSSPTVAKMRLKNEFNPTAATLRKILVHMHENPLK